MNDDRAATLAGVFLLAGLVLFTCCKLIAAAIDNMILEDELKKAKREADALRFALATLADEEWSGRKDHAAED